MTSPVPDADAAEQRASATDDTPADAAQRPDVPDGAPEADVVEQSQPVGPTPTGGPADLPLEADGADAAEQSLEVPLDEDELRE